MNRCISRILAHVAAGKTEPLSVTWGTDIAALDAALTAHSVRMRFHHTDFELDFYTFART